MKPILNIIYVAIVYISEESESVSIFLLVFLKNVRVVNMVFNWICDRVVPADLIVLKV